MKRACIGLVLFIAVVACRQQTETTKVSSSQVANGADSVTSDLSSESTDDETAGWLSDSWHSAMQTGDQSAADTKTWLNTMYKSAVDQGLTSATSMNDWVTSDLKSQGDWEYRLVTVPANALSEIEAKLNEMGSERWECFHMTEKNGDWIFFMKRSQRSVLSRLPFRDLVNILPLLSGGEVDKQ